MEFGLPITIKDNVWGGGNVCVLPGVTRGENSVIGTGAVVTKDIPANSVAVRNPAKVVKTLGEKECKYWEKKRAEYFAAKQKFLADK